MPDLSFLTEYAGHPVTLSILTIGAIIIIFMVKVFPHMKELMTAVRSSDKDLKDILAKVIASDAAQNELIRAIQTDLHDLKTGQEALRKDVNNNVLDILRITIYNEKVPIEDRLVAARRYFLLGGNGKVALYVKGLIVPYAKEWAVVLAMSTDDEKTKITHILEVAI